MRWEGDHIRVVLKPKHSRGITKEVVTRISACLISQVRYEESVWMKVRGGRGREALYIGCVYMPTDTVAVMEKFPFFYRSVPFPLRSRSVFIPFSTCRCAIYAKCARVLRGYG